MTAAKASAPAAAAAAPPGCQTAAKATRTVPDMLSIRDASRQVKSMVRAQTLGPNK
jgi:hypothetical protein